jgi:1-acyl-sn-glycerol-3-phosphate acyltransferase
MNRLALMILRNIHRVPGAYGKLCRYAKNPDRYPEQERWNHIGWMMGLAIARGNIDLQVTGLENLPKEPGFMLYGNHQGLFDVVAIAASCPVPLGAVYKKELREVPLLKQINACTKSFAMDREDVRQSLQVIQAVTKEVQQGRNYLIFPEGTRSKMGNTMGPFHGGSFRAALKAKCPIVPLALIDSFRVLDEKGSKPVSVQLHYLPAIGYEEYGHLKTVEIAELVKSRIAACIAAHIKENER